MTRIILIALVCGMVGCANVTPTVDDHTVAGWSGSVQNSGIIGIDRDGATVTPGAIDEFNALLAKYGSTLLPPRNPHWGYSPLPSGDYLMTLEAVSVWKSMLILRDRERIDGK